MMMMMMMMMMTPRKTGIMATITETKKAATHPCEHTPRQSPNPDFKRNPFKACCYFFRCGSVPKRCIKTENSWNITLEYLRFEKDSISKDQRLVPLVFVQCQCFRPSPLSWKHAVKRMGARLQCLLADLPCNKDRAGLILPWKILEKRENRLKPFIFSRRILIPKI